MTADAALIREAADRLADAATSGVPCAPVRDLLGDTDVAAAYAVQTLNVDRAVATGRRIVGRKIGLTSPVVQAQLGVDQPDFGALFADMEVGDGINIDVTGLMQPRAEAEVALVLEHDLDRGPHGFAEIIRAVAFALPAIEIVGSRITDWDISIVDTIADNASCGMYVVGGRPVPLRDVDLRSIEMTMTFGDEVVSTGSGAACLGHPIHATRWLADTLCERGTPLRAGDVVMTGALGPMRPVGAVTTVVADLGALGTVSTRIVDGGDG